MKTPLTASEIISIMVTNISSELKKRSWSLLRLSNESGVPYDTVKKLLSYRIENPQLTNIIKIAYALNCSLDELIPISTQSPEEVFQNARGFRMLRYLTEVEKSLSVCEPYATEDFIPVYTPLGNRSSGGLYEDSCSITSIPVSKYRKRFGEKLACGVRITTNSYHPVYYENDILLIGKDRMPQSGETGIFIKDGCLYLRKYVTGSYITLAPVNNIGTSIYLDSLDGWFIFGYVLSVYRS